MPNGNWLFGRHQRQRPLSGGRAMPVIDGSTYNGQDGSKISLLTTALDHVWNWYDLRMNCGLQILNFYLLAIAVLTTAYVSALNSRNYVVSVAVALAGAAVTACAYMVGARQDHVARMALTPMREIEKRLAEGLNIDSLQLVEQYRAGRKLSTYAVRAIGHFVYPVTIVICIAAAVYASFVKLFDLWQAVFYSIEV